MSNQTKRDSLPILKDRVSLSPELMNYKYILLLIIIAAGMAAVMYQHNSTNYSFDDYNYLTYAKQIYYGQFNALQSPYAYGYLLPASIALSFYIFGFSTLAASLPFILEYITIIILVYLIANKYFDEKISIATAIITSFTAFLVGYSTRLLPDVPIGLLIGLSIYILTEKDYKKAVTAGALAGMIIFIKVGALFVAPIIFVALLLVGSWKKALYFLIGFILITGIYFATIGFNTSVISNYSAQQVLNRNQTDIYANLYEGSYIIPVGYTFYSHRSVIQIFPLGLLFIYALIGGIIAVFKRRKTMLFAFIILMLTYCYLFFGTESLHSYVNITVVSRYFIWVVIPMALCCAYFLNETYIYIRSKLNNRYAIVILLCLVGFAFISNLPSLILFASHTYNFTGAPI